LGDPSFEGFFACSSSGGRYIGGTWTKTDGGRSVAHLAVHGGQRQVPVGSSAAGLGIGSGGDRLAERAPTG
jgi:hypothetical protein